MTLVFLGGMFSALAVVCLARRWMSLEWSWGVATLFLVTPLAFWQISGAGAPDIWMVFFLVTCVLVISRCQEIGEMSTAILAGVLAGGIAGTKYLGCIFAAALLAAFILETRSLKKAGAFLVISLLAGGWPYLRNLVWTGDPMFPFLMPKLFPTRVNTYGLTDLLATTGGTSTHSAWQALQFPLFAWIDPQRVGFWQFFGPLILSLMPLLFLVVRNTALWRTVITVWAVSTFVVAFSSGMMRYVLPVFPIALAAVVGGVARLEGNPHASFLRLTAKGSLLAFGAAGTFGLAVYAAPAFSASLGIQPRENYLKAASPDYQIAKFVNETLRDASEDRKVLLFVTHIYAFKVPFVYGNPQISWAVDPAVLNSPERWQQFFKTNKIAWVVRSPDFPNAIALPLTQLEETGVLVPVARTQVDNFQGKRMAGVRQKVAVVILSVKDEKP